MLSIFSCACWPPVYLLKCLFRSSAHFKIRLFGWFGVEEVFVLRLSRSGSRLSLRGLKQNFSLKCSPGCQTQLKQKHFFTTAPFVLLIFAIVSFISFSFISDLIFMISFLLLTWGIFFFVFLSLIALGAMLGYLRCFLFLKVGLYCYKLPS